MVAAVSLLTEMSYSNLFFYQESETVADIIQRLVACYGDDSGELILSNLFLF